MSKFVVFVQSIMFALTLGCSTPARAVDIAQVEKELTGEGVVGWVHGSVESRELFVFTYRNPKDFFDNVQLSLVPDDAQVAKDLAALNRHDQVRIKGEFMKNPSPQKHVRVRAVEVVKKYSSAVTASPYRHEAQIPKDLEALDRATFLVHAIGSDGHILVVEYKDQVLPIWVKNNELSKDLARGDVVALRFSIRKDPGQPTHLKIDEAAPDALVRLQSVAQFQGKPAAVEGALIMFPQSPEIIFNVFAVEDTSIPGIKRQFTLLNQDDPKVFKAIREKLQAAWDRHPKDVENARNKLISKKVRVSVKGTFQFVDANQANAQVLLKSADDIQVNFVP